MNELIRLIEAIQAEIASKASTRESLEWYLNNNLDKYRQALLDSKSNKEIENPTRVLMRFCLESMDWDTPLYQACSKLTDMGLKISREV